MTIPFLSQDSSKEIQNVPCNLPYSVLEGQILRYIRVATSETDIWKRIEMLGKEYIVNGYTQAEVMKYVLKAMQKYHSNITTIIPNYTKRNAVKVIIKAIT